MTRPGVALSRRGRGIVLACAAAAGITALAGARYCVAASEVEISRPCDDPDMRALFATAAIDRAPRVDLVGSATCSFSAEPFDVVEQSHHVLYRSSAAPETILARLEAFCRQAGLDVDERSTDRLGCRGRSRVVRIEVRAQARSRTVSMLEMIYPPP